MNKVTIVKNLEGYLCKKYQLNLPQRERLSFTKKINVIMMAAAKWMVLIQP